MYRIKKAQYLFYKHVILHGLNLTVCVRPTADTKNLTTTTGWRLFWLCLNASYVMEFFLQTLVRRHVVSQTAMLGFNRWLMLLSSVAAVQSVLRVVSWPLCALSLLLNLVHRHHDIVNTLGLAVAAVFVNRYQND